MARKRKIGWNKTYRIICVIAAVLVIYVVIQALNANADVNTRKAANAAGEKVQNYIDKNKTIPENMSVVGYSLPKSVRYERINDKTFQFCEVFKRNNNPSSSKLGLFFNLLTDRSTADIRENSINGRYGVMEVDDVHLSGIECQTVDYYALATK